MATGQTHGGKGSTTRPTDKKKYEDNWDAIFGKKTKEKEELYKAVNEVLRKEKLKEKSDG
ncbi:hypothetical protein N9E37_03455 [Luminiphilus sp.]|nr:hypothetical protein [Luminiphilus sp.]